MNLYLWLAVVLALGLFSLMIRLLHRGKRALVWIILALVLMWLAPHILAWVTGGL